jgi:hypothetical protein
MIPSPEKKARAKTGARGASLRSAGERTVNRRRLPTVFQLSAWGFLCLPACGVLLLFIFFFQKYFVGFL